MASFKAAVAVLLLGCVLSASAAGLIATKNVTVYDFCDITPADVAPPLTKDMDFVGSVKFVSLGDADIAYRRFGNSSTGRPPLVLVAGLGETSAIWPASFLEYLAEQQEVIMFDNRGIGQSTDLTEGYINVTSMALDTLAFVRGLDLDVKVNLMGWGMGGMIATTCAALHGKYYNKVIVLSGTAGSLHSRHITPTANRILMSDPEPTELEKLWLLFPLEHTSAAAAACAYFRNPEPSVVDFFNYTTFERQARAFSEFFFDVDEVYEALPKIKNDLLLVGGEDDVMIPSQGLRVIARRTTTPWLVVLREAGNAAWIQYLPSFVSMLDLFLDAYPDM
ncbi:hypothetical protein ACKKBG_A26810 [Auxenochlorella protothecoides x Auxenochlorella symbiontica]